MAVGEPIEPRVSAMTFWKAAIGFFRVTLRVVASTTVMSEKFCGTAAVVDAVAGSAMRVQLNLIASASNAVSSWNFRLGLSLSVQTPKSGVDVALARKFSFGAPVAG